MYCPKCGKEFRPKYPVTSLVKQAKVFLLSFLLPPLGFWYGLKYSIVNDAVSRRVALAAILLTSISLVLIYLLVQSFLVGVSPFVSREYLMPKFDY